MVMAVKPKENNMHSLQLLSMNCPNPLQIFSEVLLYLLALGLYS